MPSIGPQYAGAGSNVTGLGTIAWSNAGNITSDNNSNATCAFGSGSGASSNWLVSGTHDFSAIGSGDTIDGIVAEVGISASTGNRCSDTDVFLTKNGTATVGSDKATGTNVTTSEVNRTYGNSTDKWGTTWTVAEIQASTFGVMFRLLQGLGSTTASVDYIRITVYYTAGGVNHAISSTISATGTVTATALKANRGVVGTISGTSAISGAIKRNFALSATITNASSLAGTLKRNFAIAASITATGAITSNLQKFILISGSITAASAITGGLALSMPLIGTVSGVSGISGALLRNFAIAGTITGSGGISGALKNHAALTGTITGSGGISGALIKNYLLTATISAVSAIVAALKNNAAGGANIANTASITADMGINRGLITTISAVTSIAGTLTVVKNSATRAPGVIGDSNLCDMPEG